MKIYLSLLVLLLSMQAYAQNMVPNPSFEFHSSCPSGSSMLSLAAPWQSINTPDYFNSCDTSASGLVPTYGIGCSWQYPRTGNGFAGIYVSCPFGYDIREYIQVHLNGTLLADSCYLVEFYCNLNNCSLFGINSMGALLSSSAVNDVIPAGGVLQHTPQIVSDTFLTDTMNWVRVGGYFRAAGNEQFLTIGNFNTDNPADTAHIQPTGTGPASYYHIDDITVKKVSCSLLTSIADHKGKESSIQLYPNPGNGTVTISYRFDPSDKASLSIYDLSGKRLCTYAIDPSNDKLAITNAPLSNGIYFYTVLVNGKLVKQEKLVVISD